MADDRKDSDKESSEREKRGVGDVVRELTATGLAALFMTEDTLRGLLKDKNIPKELAALVMDNLGKRKDDLYGLVAKEVGRVLSKIDVTAEVSRFLEKHKIHLEAKVSFEPKITTPTTPETPKKETT